MFCMKCGSYLENGVKFCTKCETELGEVKKQKGFYRAQDFFAEQSYTENLLDEQISPLWEEKIEAPKSTKKKRVPAWIAAALFAAVLFLVCGGVVGYMILHGTNGNEEGKQMVAKEENESGEGKQTEAQEEIETGEGNSDSKYAAAIENYIEVNGSVMDLVATNEYEQADTSEKAVQILELLAKLENDGQVAGGSVNYNEAAKVIAYEYADGAYGCVMLEGFAEGVSGVGESSYVSEYGEDGLPSVTQTIPDFGLNSSPYEENPQALVLYGLGEESEETLEMYKDFQQEWVEGYMDTTLEEDCTVEKMRTELSGYDFITIRLHGFIYNDIPTIYLQEEASLWYPGSVITKRNYLPAEDIYYLDDFVSHRIGTAIFSDGKYHYFLLPEFFTYYYGNNQLDDAIVWLGCCSGYRNDFLVKAFADCGAKSVLGCTETVWTAYGTLMNEAFTYMLLCGNTVKESLSFAKSVWGDNDKIFSLNVWNIEDTDPSEFRYYNGGTETLVMLTDEVDINEKAHAAYEEVLNQYKAILSEPDLLEEESDAVKAVYPYVDVYQLSLNYYTNNYKTAVWYSYYDIDSNGIDELILYFGEENYIRLEVIYTYGDSAVITLLDEFTDRYSLKIYTDGTIYVSGSGGWAWGSGTLYSFNEDGTDLDIVAEYEWDFEAFPDTPYYDGKDYLTESEWDAVFEDKVECELKWEKWCES